MRMRALALVALALGSGGCIVDVSLTCSGPPDLGKICGPGQRCQLAGGRVECLPVPEDGAAGDGGLVDDGGPVEDGGRLDGGGTGEDGGLADGGAAVDGGPADGGPAIDGGPADGGPVLHDGGPLPVDGGPVVVDGGPADGGPADGGPVVQTPCGIAAAAPAGAALCPPVQPMEMFTNLCALCVSSPGGTADFACMNLNEDLLVSTSDIKLPPGCYQYNNVKVSSNRTLTLDQWRDGQPTVLLSRGRFEIDASGRIEADSLGHPSGDGPGRGLGFPGSGGGHGGAGGDALGSLRGIENGDPCVPMSWGSGGGPASQLDRLGKGGGAIALIAEGTDAMVINGVVSAGGANGALDSGGGAGGSIVLAAATVEGSGTISVRGGDGNTGGGGGGGGRIRLIGDWSGFSGAIEARGGAGAARGRPGTLVADSFPSPWVVRGGFALVAQDYRLGTVDLSDGVSEIWIRRSPSLAAGSPLLHLSALRIASGNRLTAEGEGFPGAAGPGAGGGDSLGGGGGHGGAGGDGTRGSGGGTYGDPDQPLDLGSGGASDHGGTGGGLVLVCIEGNLELDGAIDANGESRSVLASSPGGSGGSVYVQAKGALVGAGQFAARGGAAAGLAGGGGGGRIKVIAGSRSFTGSCDASGAGSGGSGTTRCN